MMIDFLKWDTNIYHNDMDYSCPNRPTSSPSYQSTKDCHYVFFKFCKQCLTFPPYIELCSFDLFRQSPFSVTKWGHGSEGAYVLALSPRQMENSKSYM